MRQARPSALRHARFSYALLSHYSSVLRRTWGCPHVHAGSASPRTGVGGPPLSPCRTPCARTRLLQERTEMRAHGQGAVWGYRRAPHAAAYRRVGRRLRAADVCALSDTARCARPLRDAHAWLQHGECPAEGPLHRHVSRRRGRYGGHRRPGQGWKVREEESWQRKQARQHRPEYVVSHHSTSHDADVWHEHASQYCGGESFGSGPLIPTLTSA